MKIQITNTEISTAKSIVFALTGNHEFDVKPATYKFAWGSYEVDSMGDFTFEIKEDALRDGILTAYSTYREEFHTVYKFGKMICNMIDGVGEKTALFKKRIAKWSTPYIYKIRLESALGETSVRIGLYKTSPCGGDDIVLESIVAYPTKNVAEFDASEAYEVFSEEFRSEYDAHVAWDKTQTVFDETSFDDFSKISSFEHMLETFNNVVFNRKNAPETYENIDSFKV